MMKWVLPLMIILIFSPCLKAEKTGPINSTEKTEPIPKNLGELPSFPGGFERFEKFLTKHLKWPKNAMDAQGRVVVGFVVEKDGRLTHCKILHGIGKAYGTEALRVVKNPQNGYPDIRMANPSVRNSLSQ